MLTEYAEPKAPVKALFRRVFEILSPWIPHLERVLQQSIRLMIVVELRNLIWQAGEKSCKELSTKRDEDNSYTCD
jgi:hypothetical protein